MLLKAIIRAKFREDILSKFSMQALDFDSSVCIAAICYSGPISDIPTNEQLLGEKTTGTKFQIDISKTKRLVRLYIDGRTDGHG